MKKLVISILGLLILSCAWDNPFDKDNDDKLKFSVEGKPALVAVIENHNLVGEDADIAFYFYHEEMLQIFSQVFNVPVEEIGDMELEDIVDVYGEQWQLDEIERIAADKYEKIITLSDKAAAGSALLDSLIALQQQDYDIDMIFNLHGNSSGILFGDEFYNIEAFTKSLKMHGVKIRSLYQTCCYGSDMIDEWELLDIIAVTGAYAENSLALFSPMFFLENWLSGMSFHDAVYTATQIEVDQICSFDDILPQVEYLITEEDMQDSKQLIGGYDENLVWRLYPIW